MLGSRAGRTAQSSVWQPGQGHACRVALPHFTKIALSTFSTLELRGDPVTSRCGKGAALHSARQRKKRRHTWREYHQNASTRTAPAVAAAGKRSSYWEEGYTASAPDRNVLAPAASVKKSRTVEATMEKTARPAVGGTACGMFSLAQNTVVPSARKKVRMLAMK